MRKLVLLLLCCMGCGRSVTAPACSVVNARQVDTLRVDSAVVVLWVIC